MTSCLGFDLNGLWDFVADGDGVSDTLLKDLGIHGSLIRFLAEEDRWIGGAQAALAPHGKGSGWAKIGATENRIFLKEVLDTLARGLPGAAQSAAFQNFLEALAVDAGTAVFTVPDVPGFDEAARDRLLQLLARSGRLRSTLLWRPMAAVLGWLEEVTETQASHPSDGQRIAVISLMDTGIQMADAKLCREIWNGAEIWVPERDRAGIEIGGSCAGVVLADQAGRGLAHALGVADEVALSALNAPWCVAVGQKPGFELLRLPNRSWQRVPEIPTSSIALVPDGLRDAIGDRLTKADMLIVEGPMAGHAAWVDAALRAAGWPANRPIHRAGRGFVAKGCLAAALRAQAGKPVYYDFLPQLEINALVDDAPRFVELIPKNTRLPGGSPYKANAHGEFAIGKGASRLTFYLFKEDFSKGRKAEVELPEQAVSQHGIRVSVEQVPGQGLARVRIESDSFEALRRQPLELDWLRMETVEETRAEILIALAGQSGLAYPDAVSKPGHPLHWHPDHRAGHLLAQLQAYIDRPLLKGNAVDNTTHQALQVLRKRYSVPENPSFVAKRMNIHCEDNGSFRALDSNGALPTPMGDLAVPENAASLLNAALEKADEEFKQVMARMGRRADPELIGDIVGFATWCFWRCPPSIAEFALELYEGIRIFPVHHILLREGVGRIVHHPDYLKRYFVAVDARLNTDGPLTAAEFSALGRVLGGCPEAADLLPKRTADRILQETIAVLAEENTLSRSQAYKRKFKAALLMLAALLRHRRVRPAFLDPEQGTAARHLLDTLAKAENSNQRFEKEEERTAQRAAAPSRASHSAAARRFAGNAEILAMLIEFIHERGADPNIIRKIEEMEE